MKAKKKIKIYCINIQIFILIKLASSNLKHPYTQKLINFPTYVNRQNIFIVFLPNEYLNP